MDNSNTNDYQTAPSTDCEKQEIGWSAWHNAMPMSTPTLYVRGKQELPTPGFTLSLSEAVPQGINPAILVLRLKTTKPTGIQPDVLTGTCVAFQKEVGPIYSQVQIVDDETGDGVTTIEVKQTS